jgi:hypothetical protein
MGSVSQYEETVVMASFFGVVWMGFKIRDIMLSKQYYRFFYVESGCYKEYACEKIYQ